MLHAEGARGVIAPLGTKRHTRYTSRYKVSRLGFFGFTKIMCQQTYLPIAVAIPTRNQ